MKKIVTLILLTLMVFSCNGQVKNNVEPDTKPDNSNEVNTQDIKTIVSYLASDELKGRDTGTDGIDKAATYIQNYFKNNNVKPYFNTYRDEFKIQSKGKELTGFNVVGLVEGNDATLKNEYIVIGAHYDHIGFVTAIKGDSIANGANDNATGTSVVMNLAKHFAKAKSSKRSIIFALFSAEEKGLKGSEHIAKRLKSQNIDLYTMINFEMLGVPFKDRGYEVFLTGFDRSNFAEKFNAYQGSNIIGASEVSKKYSLFMRSDNYAFFKEFNVPSHTISSCDLTNFDHYHKAGDEVEEMDFPFMANFINKIIPSIEKLANTTTKEIKLTDE